MLMLIVYVCFQVWMRIHHVQRRYKFCCRNITNVGRLFFLSFRSTKVRFPLLTCAIWVTSVFKLCFTIKRSLNEYWYLLSLIKYILSKKKFSNIHFDYKNFILELRQFWRSCNTNYSWQYYYTEMFRFCKEGSLVKGEWNKCICWLWDTVSYITFDDYGTLYDT